MFSPLISTQSLASLLPDPAWAIVDLPWAIVDCRFDLAQPQVAYASYQEAHIPGAVYANLNQDLSSPVTPTSGRHPLPGVEDFTRQLGAWGISNNTPVVAYDSNGGAYAVRLWWLLRYVGHKQVAVLDGGFPKWQHEGRPVASGVEYRPPAQYIPHPNPAMIADAAEVERIRQDPDYRLVDARAAVRYHGEQEPIDAVAGHIPGAINRFHGHNLTPDSTFKPSEKLRAQFEALLDGAPPENMVSYCGSGVTAIHHLLAMELAGLPGARLYPGSWSEWIRDPHRPIAKD